MTVDPGPKLIALPFLDKKPAHGMRGARKKKKEEKPKGGECTENIKIKARSHWTATSRTDVVYQHVLLAKSCCKQWIAKWNRLANNPELPIAS